MGTTFKAASIFSGKAYDSMFKFFMLNNDLPRALARGNKAPQPFSILGFSPQKLQGVKTPDRPGML
jgi:hypothetical protein